MLEDWVKIVFGFLGGGLIGAIVTNTWTDWRNRILPVGYRTETDRLFTPNEEFSSLQASITVMHENEPFSFNNLSIAQIELINRGSKDLSEFTFGVTLSADKKVIFSEYEGQDRHHSIAPVDPACPINPLSIMDFVCKPFHRGNVYQLRLYIVTSEGGDPTTTDIGLTSPDSVQFVEAPSMKEMLQEVILGSTLYIGPVKLSIRNPRL